MVICDDKQAPGKWLALLRAVLLGVWTRRKAEQRKQSAALLLRSAMRSGAAAHHVQQTFPQNATSALMCLQLSEQDDEKDLSMLSQSRKARDVMHWHTFSNWACLISAYKWVLRPTQVIRSVSVRLLRRRKMRKWTCHSCVGRRWR